MTELLSLPDDVLGFIVLKSLTDSSITRLDKRWCRIASTSRRLWTLHLPHTPHPIIICNEQHTFNADGEWRFLPTQESISYDKSFMSLSLQASACLRCRRAVVAKAPEICQVAGHWRWREGME